ncbi:MerR family transcriptional regulator [Rhizobium sp. CRIBSB]|nr:MerR family transcriptional regulator [Rhizobium sp. CRIBSB]
MAKSQSAFRTISEAAEEIGAPQHVLRFWETKFAFITPLKRAGGRRFYRPEDILILKAVRRLLHDRGLTIKGVLQLHKEQGLKALAAHGEDGSRIRFDPSEAGTAAPPPVTASGQPTIRLRQALIEIEAARTRLEAALVR